LPTSPFRVAALAAITIAVAAALAACGSSAKSASSTSSGGGSGFPATVTATNGPVVVTHRPSRIVSLSPTATQMLYSIGAGSQVVAVDEYSTLPANAPHTNLNALQVSAEGLETYRPDLVLLAPGGQANLIRQLATLKVPALMLPPANNLTDTWSQYRQIGRATGHVSQANQEISHLQNQISAAVKSAAHAGKGRTYYIEFSSDLYTATSKTFDGTLFSMMGLKNIADTASGSGDGYPQLSAEFLLKSDPDYVFLADDVCCGQSAATFAARAGYSTLSAVGQHHIYLINDNVAGQWGPNIVEFVQDVERALKGGQSR
jgi:iron complex transport system substrate-binding protein